MSNVGNGPSGDVLTGNGVNAPPTWKAPATSGTVTDVTGTANQVAVATGTTTPVISLIGPYTPATYGAHGVLLGEGTSSIVATAVGTTGQVLTGVTGADPVWAAPAGGSVTFTGDTGTPFATNSVTIYAGHSALATGSSVLFNASTPNLELLVTDTNNNTIVGQNSGNLTLVGAGANSNSSFGASNLGALTSGANNEVFGYNSLIALTDGSNNTSVGYGNGNQAAHLFGNIFIGNSIGGNYSNGETNNILIGSGTTDVAAENNTIRLGFNSGFTKCYVGGINGNTLGGTPDVVTIDTSTGQLGVAAFPSGGSGIVTINGNSGSVTGATVTVEVGPGYATSEGTAVFTNGGTGSHLTFTSQDGNENLGIGLNSLYHVSGGLGNTALGLNALTTMVSGVYNTAIGRDALAGATSSQNTAVGNQCLQSCTGQQNAALGSDVAPSMTSGSYNVLLGFDAGPNYSGAESSNILIGCQLPGTTSESNVCRIGNATGTGLGNLNATFIQGISGTTVTGTAVLCSTSGQLGTVVSSARYKDDIKPIADNVSVLSLKPSQFVYKSDETKSVQYGLIAEEVEKDFPYLCFYKDGQPESVKYHELPVLLLKEIQRLNDRITALEAK